LIRLTLIRLRFGRKFHFYLHLPENVLYFLSGANTNNEKEDWIMRNQIKIRVHETGKIVITKAEFKKGCILPDGSWIDKGKYTELGTLGCCVCGNTVNLIKKETWYGPRMTCIKCKPPQNYPVCVWCRKRGSEKIQIGRRIIYLCVEHYRIHPMYNKEHDLFAEIPLETLEKEYA
jgi:hypothetical protein